MKTAKLTLMFLACAAAIPAIAQNTTDSRCGMTNYDSSRNVFTIVRPTSGTPNQQCFITVVSKQSWAGGMPELTSSQLVEGNYEIALSGGGGGGGGGKDRVGGGDGGSGAIPFTTVRYLQPGVYRLTIGSGGQGGAANGGNGGDGAPTSLSNANSSELVAGFSGAESWNGAYPWSHNVASVRRDDDRDQRASLRREDDRDQRGSWRREDDRDQRRAAADSRGGQAMSGEFNGGRGGRVGRHPNGEDGSRLTAVAYAGEPGKGGTDLAGDRIRHEVGGGGGGGAGFGNGGSGGSAAEDGKMKTGAKNGDLGAGGGGGAGGEGVAEAGAAGGNGFIKIALKDPPPPAASTQTAPAYVAPAESVAPVSPAEVVAPVRPARMDRN